jgi:hypothetical protein
LQTPEGVRVTLGRPRPVRHTSGDRQVDSPYKRGPGQTESGPYRTFPDARGPSVGASQRISL